MHYFLLPLVPLTIAGAIFFKNRFAAYGFPVVLTLIKMFTTKVSLTYAFMAVALMAAVFLTRKLNKSPKISLPLVAGSAVLGVFLYAVVTNFGVWILGGCVSGSEPLYALSFSGMLSCYKAALPYAGVHLLKAVPLTIVLVQAFQWIKQWKVSLDLQRLISNKA